MNSIAHFSNNIRSILAIDYGSKYSGIAVASGEVKIAKPLKTFTNLNDGDLILEISEIVNEYGVNIILVGNPLNLNGQKSQQSLKSEEFIAKLKYRFKNLTVLEQAETDTSNWALSKLGEAEVNKQLAKKNGQLDALAAARILQDYLDENGFSSPKIQE
jgi:putative Holliday junction resolvase